MKKKCDQQQSRQETGPDKYTYHTHLINVPPHTDSPWVQAQAHPVIPRCDFLRFPLRHIHDPHAERL